jgi:hypothetical protein
MKILLLEEHDFSEIYKFSINKKHTFWKIISFPTFHILTPYSNKLCMYLK